MRQLTCNSTHDFLHRFCNFDDAVLRTANINLRSGCEQCCLMIEAPDRESPSGWSHVEILIQDIQRIHLDRSGRCIEVLTCGLQVFFAADVVYLFLDANCVDESMPEISSNLAFVSGTGIQWESKYIQHEP